MISRRVQLGWVLAAALVGTLGGCTCEAPAKPPKTGGETATAGDGAAQESALDVDPREMTSARMLSVARGEEKLGTLVDRSKGLVVVERRSDPSDEDGRLQDGWVSVARRVCGEPLELILEKLERDLKSRARYAEEDAQYTENGTVELFNCEAMACTHASTGEYDREGTYRFKEVDGRLVLDSVAHLETAVIVEEAIEGGRQYIARELKRLEAGNCTNDSKVNEYFYRVCNTAADREPGLPLREEANWSREQPSVLGNEAMLDGQLVEDMGRRERGWWRVRVFKGEERYDGWVQARNREPGSPGAGHPTLCPAR